MSDLIFLKFVEFGRTPKMPSLRSCLLAASRDPIRPGLRVRTLVNNMRTLKLVEGSMLTGGSSGGVRTSNNHVEWPAMQTYTR